MQFTLTPQRRNAPMVLSVAGDVLTIDSADYDFSTLPEGGEQTIDQIDSDMFSGPVTRVNGELHIALILPVGARAPHESLFPAPLIVTADGPVMLPAYEVEEEVGGGG